MNTTIDQIGYNTNYFRSLKPEVAVAELASMPQAKGANEAEKTKWAQDTLALINKDYDSQLETQKKLAAQQKAVAEAKAKQG